MLSIALQDQPSGFYKIERKLKDHPKQLRQFSRKKNLNKSFFPKQSHKGNCCGGVTGKRHLITNGKSLRFILNGFKLGPNLVGQNQPSVGYLIFPNCNVFSD